MIVRDNMKFYRDFVDGWMAVVDAKKGNGLVTELNYDQLDQELFWLQPESHNTTVEWLYTPVTLNPSERWETETRAAVFTGLNRVSFARPELVGNLTHEGDALQLSVFGLESGEWRVAGAAQPGDRKLEDRTLSVAAGKISSLNWPIGESRVKWANLTLQRAAAKYEIPIRLVPVSEAADFRIAAAKKNPPPLVKGPLPEKIAIRADEQKKGSRIRVLSVAASGEATDLTYRALRGRDRVRHFLSDRSEFEVDCAQDATLLSFLPRLYSYHVLVIDGAPGNLLEPYIADLQKWVESGRGLVLLGGPLSFGGSDPQLPNWKSLAPLLPVSILQSPDYVVQKPVLEGERRKYRESGGEREYVIVTHPDGKEPFAVPAEEAPAFPTHGWLAQGRRIQTVLPEHPVAKDIDLASLAPSYHRVAVLPGSEVIAEMTASSASAATREPILVTRKLGSGRVVVFLAGDLCRLHAWPQTPELVARMVTWASGRAVVSRMPPALVPDPVGIRLNFHRKRAWLRGEKAPFTVERLTDQREALQVTVRLIDEYGQQVAQQQLALAADKPSCDGVLDLADLAFGAYRVEAEVAGGFRSVDRIAVVPPVSADFPVLYYGCGMSKYQGTTLESLAKADLLAEQTNVLFTGRLSPPTADVRELLDHCAEKGMGVLFWDRQITSMGPPDWRANVQRHPDKISAAVQQVVEIMKDYDRHPAAFGIFLADEGSSFSYTDYDRKIFREKYGMEMPVPPATEQERARSPVLNPPKPTGEEEFRLRLNLADYQSESLDLLFSAAAKELRQRFPKLVVTSLFTISSPGQYGVFMDRVFRPLDNLLVDIYPASVHGVAQCQAMYAMLRSAAARAKKPWWLVAASWRNNPAGARMQYWMALGSAMRGLGWYSTVDSLQSDVWEALIPYNQKLLEYGPLLARWEKPASKIAVLYADAEVARTDYSDHHRGLYQVFSELYAHDLYADTVTEAQLRDGSVNEYETLVLPRNLQLERDVVEKITDFARRKPVYPGPETLVAIPGAKPFDAAEIRKRIRPDFTSPDANVYVEPLISGDLHYAIAYNRNPVPIEETITARDFVPVAVYDLWTGERFPVKGCSATVKLAPYEGRMLAWLPFDPAKLVVEVKGKPSPGNAVTVAVSQSAQGNRRGLLPLSVDVFAPDGSRVAGYSFKAVMVDGRLSFPIQFVKNDPAGKWRIVVTDLVTRRTVEALVPR